MMIGAPPNTIAMSTFYMPPPPLSTPFLSTAPLYSLSALPSSPPSLDTCFKNMVCLTRSIMY